MPSPETYLITHLASASWQVPKSIRSIHAFTAYCSYHVVLLLSTVYYRSLVLKACPSFAQTEVQLRPQHDSSMLVRHDKLCQPAHKAMCLAFALQAMSQKHMHSAAASSLQKPISVHDAPSLQPSSELAVAVIGLQPFFSGCDWHTIVCCLSVPVFLSACLPVLQ